MQLMRIVYFLTIKVSRVFIGYNLSNVMFSNASIVTLSNIQCSSKLMRAREARKNTIDDMDSI